VAKRYNNKPLGDVEPHIFAIADVAYQTMMEDGGNRSVIISGESGAGKTEATKLLLQYLALKTSGVNKAHSAPEASTKKKSLIEQLILESSPILEAFGNAKTVRTSFAVCVVCACPALLIAVRLSPIIIPVCR
jgi:myosin heavy subunit